LLSKALIDGATPGAEVASLTNNPQTERNSGMGIRDLPTRRQLKIAFQS